MPIFPAIEEMLPQGKLFSFGLVPDHTKRCTPRHTGPCVVEAPRYSNHFSIVRELFLKGKLKKGAFYHLIPEIAYVKSSRMLHTVLIFTP